MRYVLMCFLFFLGSLAHSTVTTNTFIEFKKSVAAETKTIKKKTFSERKNLAVEVESLVENKRNSFKPGSLKKPEDRIYFVHLGLWKDAFEIIALNDTSAKKDCKDKLPSVKSSLKVRGVKSLHPDNQLIYDFFKAICY